MSASTPTTQVNVSSASAATFGDITSGAGECVVGNPNSYVTTADIDWVWEHTLSNFTPIYTNWAFDQLVTSNGSLNYCVRWDSKQKLSKSVAAKFEAMLTRQINLWNHWLVGYDCWPFSKIEINVVGWAVKDKSLFDWSDDSLGTIYEGVLDEDGSPKCPDECSKHRDQAASADTSACKGKGVDMTLWPSDYVAENAVGLASDWGQKVEVTDMLANMNNEQMVVLAHEMGHSFGLLDTYVAENKPAGFPPSLMDESTTFTDADGWMLRRVLEHLKSRYNF